MVHNFIFSCFQRKDNGLNLIYFSKASKKMGIFGMHFTITAIESESEVTQSCHFLLDKQSKHIFMCKNTYLGEGDGTPTPVLLPGKSHGRRSLVGCSPWGR